MLLQDFVAILDALKMAKTEAEFQEAQRRGFYFDDLADMIGRW